MATNERERRDPFPSHPPRVPAVTQVTADMTDNAKWTIVAERHGSSGRGPDSHDVPPDIRAALRSWLDQAEGR